MGELLFVVTSVDVGYEKTNLVSCANIGNNTNATEMIHHSNPTGNGYWCKQLSFEPTLACQYSFTLQKGI